MRLIQYFTPDRERRVGVIPDDSGRAYEVRSGRSVRDIALQAHRDGVSLARMVDMLGVGDALDYEALVAEKRLLVPLDHPDPHHMFLSVTGLTHLGSAKSRDAMHAKLQQGDLTDSMKMFEFGLKGGRPASGAIGVQSEWVYKGNGNWCIAPEGLLELPGYGASGGEEAEIAGLYLIGDKGEVLRVGYALGNEFSDHTMERVNYLYLAHSKLRKSSFGPELLVGELPADVSGTVRIRRGDQVVWQDQFLSGEENMCHSLANLEHHHFKYSGFRSPGDVHVHFFGASVLSHASGIVAAPGDLFEIDSPVFGRPLRNTLSAGAAEELVIATAL
jgi:hypothetical protein